MAAAKPSLPPVDVVTVSKVASLFTISVAGETREIKMSYGLMDALTHIINGAESVGLILMDKEIRRAVVEAVLAKRKPSGMIDEEIDYDDLDVELEDMERLLEWVTEHVMGFFVRSLQTVVKVNDKNLAAIKKVESSLAGLNE